MGQQTRYPSESRKKSRANFGVARFFDDCRANHVPLFVSVVTVGELRRGVELIRHRGDATQAHALETWLAAILTQYAEHVLDFTYDDAQVWGRLRVPRAENPIDKQIAATALTHDLTLVTRNTAHFAGLGVTLVNPFS